MARKQWEVRTVGSSSDEWGASSDFMGLLKLELCVGLEFGSLPAVPGRWCWNLQRAFRLKLSTISPRNPKELLEEAAVALGVPRPRSRGGGGPARIEETIGLCEVFQAFISGLQEVQGQKGRSAVEAFLLRFEDPAISSA